MEDTPNEPVAKTRVKKIITDPFELERRRLKNNVKCAKYVAKNHDKVLEYQRVKQSEYYHKRRAAVKGAAAAPVKE